MYSVGGEKMPRFDGTGPRGDGPKTGRGLGNCDGPVKGGSNRPRGGRGPRGNRPGRGN